MHFKTAIDTSLATVKGDLKKLNIHDLNIEDTIVLVGFQIMIRYQCEPLVKETFQAIEARLNVFGQWLIELGILEFFNPICGISHSMNNELEARISWKLKGSSKIITSIVDTSTI